MEAQMGETLARLLEEGKLPRLIAFDLDYTLWSCYCEFQLPPFTPARRASGTDEEGQKQQQQQQKGKAQRHSGGRGADAYDKHGAGIRLYSAVRPIFQALLALQADVGVRHTTSLDNLSFKNADLSLRVHVHVHVRVRVCM
jgi:hypothetical protein